MSDPNGCSLHIMSSMLPWLSRIICLQPFPTTMRFRRCWKRTWLELDKRPAKLARGDSDLRVSWFDKHQNLRNSQPFCEASSTPRTRIRGGWSLGRTRTPRKVASRTVGLREGSMRLHESLRCEGPHQKPTGFAIHCNLATSWMSPEKPEEQVSENEIL